MSDALNDTRVTVRNFSPPKERPVWARALRSTEIAFEEAKDALRSGDDVAIFLRLADLAQAVDDLIEVTNEREG